MAVLSVPIAHYPNSMVRDFNCILVLLFCAFNRMRMIQIVWLGALIDKADSLSFVFAPVILVILSPYFLWFAPCEWKINISNY